MNTQSSSQPEMSALEIVEHTLIYMEKIGPPPDPSLPGRQVIPTYLKKLDKQWRGGWSWQWPMVIAGPPEGGKTHFAYQLIASTLLSCPDPWRALYFDFKGDYRPEFISKILGIRRKQTSHGYLGRLDKISLLSSNSLGASLQLMTERNNLCLFIVDAWNYQLPGHQKTTWWEGLAKVAQKKQMALLITVRGELDSLLNDHPFESIPYFVFITKKKHHFHRIRVWQNSSRTKIYDQVVKLNGYFREKLPSSSHPLRD